MSLSKELEKAVLVVNLADECGGILEFSDAADNALYFLRDHGQALLDALEDGDRLDWLFNQLSGEALRKIGVVYSEPSEYRQAIDAAIKGNG